VGYVVRMGEIKMRTIFWLKNLKGADHSEGVDRKIILEWILGK